MKERLCQSCGMHLGDGDRGTNAGGSLSDDYCLHCLQNGYFTSDLTREQMVDFCSQFVDANNLKANKLFSRETFKIVLDSTLSTLKRWTLPAGELPPIMPISIRKPSVDEINSLGLPNCPPITDLRVVRGSLINFMHDVNGNRVHLLDNDSSYWCTQVNKTNGAGGCYGIAVGEQFIIVNEWFENVENIRLVMLKRRA